MTVAQRIGALEKNLELARQSDEFISLVRVLLQAKGNLWAARQFTDRISPRVREVLNSDHALGDRSRRGGPADQFMTTKAAASALALDSSAFATFQLLVSGFVNALSSIGVFDQMRTAMRAVPVGRTLGAVTTAAAGYVVGEGSTKQVSKLSLTNGTLEPQKAHCIIAVANELLKMGGREVDVLITRELTNACVLAI
jgi:hypothetical protein